MAREKKLVHKIQMTEEKRNIIMYCDQTLSISMQKRIIPFIRMAICNTETRRMWA